MMSTKMLASVKNLEEAVSILSTGVDIIDIKDPVSGALGAVEPGLLQLIIKKIAGQVITSATIGDLPMQITKIASGIDKVLHAGADIIKIGIFSRDTPANVLKLIGERTAAGNRIVLVFFADLITTVANFNLLADHGVYGVMLDTADKSKGSLRTILTVNELDSFVSAAQAAGLLTGLAGSLQQRDIKPLLELNPDFLGFRSALCIKYQRKMTIDINAVNQIRSMIPLENNHPEKISAII
jgi:(5-formylfuran-3-yl)methyl phosphate synthase